MKPCRTAELCTRSYDAVDGRDIEVICNNGEADEGHGGWCERAKPAK